MTQMALFPVAVTRCGYCDRPLTLQPEDDWACSPCRALMAEMIVGPDPLLVAQYRSFQRRARRRG